MAHFSARPGDRAKAAGRDLSIGPRGIIGRKLQIAQNRQFRARGRGCRIGNSGEDTPIRLGLPRSRSSRAKPIGPGFDVEVIFVIGNGCDRHRACAADDNACLDDAFDIGLRGHARIGRANPDQAACDPARDCSLPAVGARIHREVSSDRDQGAGGQRRPNRRGIGECDIGRLHPDQNAPARGVSFCLRQTFTLAWR